jgi:hypothetical protein
MLIDGGKHKGLLNYKKNCGMSSLKKHVISILKGLVWGLYLMQAMIKSVNEKQIAKKWKVFFPFHITNLFGN